MYSRKGPRIQYLSTWDVAKSGRSTFFENYVIFRYLDPHGWV